MLGTGLACGRDLAEVVVYNRIPTTDELTGLRDRLDLAVLNLCYRWVGGDEPLGKKAPAEQDECAQRDREDQILVVVHL